MKKLSVNSPEYRDLVSKLLGREVKFEDVPEIPVSKSPVLMKSLPRLESPPIRKKVAVPKKAAKKSDKKTGKKTKKTKKTKYYITEETFNKVDQDFYNYFEEDFDWKNVIKYIEVRIVNMYVIREVSFRLSLVFRNEDDFSEEAKAVIEESLMDADCGNAIKDIKNGNLEKVSSDLVLGFFDPKLLEIFEENDIKITTPVYNKGKKVNIEIKPDDYIEPILSDDT